MAADTKVIIDMEQKGIEITCKHCKKSQTYTMRSKEIPKRPKTQCQNCEKWIYIDRSLLVKKFGQKDLVKKDLVKKDQKKEIPDVINQKERAINSHKTKEKTLIRLTKTIDQRPKTNDQKIIRSVGNIHTLERNKERLYDIYFKTDTIENLAKKYEIPTDYLNKLKSKFKKLKHPPRIENNKLVCYQCGKEKEKRLVFHHNHKTNEYIALVCDSCNQKLENHESVIYPLQDNKKKGERLESINNNALSISEKREYLNPKFIEEMGQELRLFGTTIPMDKKQEIVNWVFKNIQNLYDGVYNYQRIWKTRYKNYLVKMPDSPVIEKFQSMGNVLEFIKKIKILKEELENAKNGK